MDKIDRKITFEFKVPNDENSNDNTLTFKDTIRKNNYGVPMLNIRENLIKENNNLKKNGNNHYESNSIISNEFIQNLNGDNHEKNESLIEKESQK